MIDARDDFLRDPKCIEQSIAEFADNIVSAATLFKRNRLRPPSRNGLTRDA